MRDEPEAIAGQIMTRFALYRVDFQQSTGSARDLFQEADWHGIQNLGQHRLTRYHQHCTQVYKRLQGLEQSFDSEDQRSQFWRETKIAFEQLLAPRFDWELAETFYNSVYRRLNSGRSLPPDELFVSATVPTPPARADRPLWTGYTPDNGMVDMMQRLLASLPVTLPWRNFDQDVRNILRSLPEERPEIDSPRSLRIELLNSMFYRNKGVYAVGKLRFGDQCWPFALPLLQDTEGRLYVDTLICDEDDLSIMFSFTRAYFLVDTTHPGELVDFLEELLPNKQRWELYNAVGLNKHGKTEFYRSFLEHLDNSDDQFIVAAGIKGMVMTVFTLPSFNTVFKIIKDRFAPQKNITPKEVKEKYRIVKNHDRVGRMADTQEFNDMSFPRDRFTDELLEELVNTAASVVEVTEDRVHIRHLYTERLMIPLNLYIADADETELRSVLDEYGNAIRQLAAANIFPGDMLLKNFGVTRHGRVVFYDYDEICYLEEMNFREIPEPRTPEEEMSADVWYSVGPYDVFPEEFRKFLFGRRNIKQLFTDLHGELFAAPYWRSLQEDIKAGEIKNVFPYRRKKRFRNQSAPASETHRGTVNP